MMTLKPTFDSFEAEGTVFGSLGKTDFEKIKVLAPSKEVIQRFENMVGLIDKKIEDNTLQTLSLSSIRDSLLPKLMSGKIRVPHGG
jgi:type I restriction enzyme S subunit